MGEGEEGWEDDDWRWRVMKTLRRIRMALKRPPSTRYALVDRGPFTMAYRPGTTDEDVLFRESFDHDQYLHIFPELSLAAGDTIVDIGAHLGGFAVLAASRVGKVYAIEAARETFDVLSVNKHLNHAANLTVSHLALTDRRGTVTLYESPTGNWGNSLTPHGDSRGETVSSMTLAEYFVEQGITSVALLKCNAEGAEFPIFLNTPRAVLQRIAYLVILYHEDLAVPHQKDALLGHLASAGFLAKVALEQSPQRGAIIARRE